MSEQISINFDDDQTPTEPQTNGQQQDDGTTPPPVNDEVEKLKAEIAQLKESVARAQADFANFRRRQTQEMENLAKFASSECISELLPVIDNLQRAFTHIPEEISEHQWIQGIFAIEKQFLQTMEKLGLKKIITIGEKADPNFHEIIGTTEQENTEPDTITDEIEAGYMLNDRVLRVAKVRVQK